MGTSSEKGGTSIDVGAVAVSVNLTIAVIVEVGAVEVRVGNGEIVKVPIGRGRLESGDDVICGFCMAEEFNGNTAVNVEICEGLKLDGGAGNSTMLFSRFKKKNKDVIKNIPAKAALIHNIRRSIGRGTNC